MAEWQASIHYPSWIRERIVKRQDSNPRYSLRSYARAVGISPATLSEILNERRVLSLQTALKIADFEKLKSEVRRQFIEPLVNQSKKDNRGKNKIHAFEKIASDKYHLIADWYHFAILSLGKLKNNRADPKWIAKRLAITEKQATQAYGRLKRLGLIKEVGQQFVPTKKQIATATDQPNPDLRRSHRQLLKRVAQSLDEVSVEKRDFSTMYISLNESRVPEIKKILRRFRRRLHTKFDGKQANSVFACGLYFFPVTSEHA